MIAMETTVGSESSRTLPSISLSPGLQRPCNSEEEDEAEAEAEQSTVPGTPPPKKVGAGSEAEDGMPGGSSLHNSLGFLFFQFRSLFFGSILAPAHSPLGPSPVLAEDSEGEG